MARTEYERLSPEAAVMVRGESPRRFAHSGSTLVFDAGPLAYSHGGVDFSAVRGAIASRIAQVPHYHRRLRRIPLENHPVWIDDNEFRLDYHVRHTSLPRPGSLQQLRKVAARVQGQRLDRSRPLWEYWVVEGLEGGRFALIAKTHYALVHDAGMDALQLLLSPDPEALYESAAPHRPKASPTGLELLYDEVVRRARQPRRAWRLTRGSLRPSEEWSGSFRERMDKTARMLGYTLASRHDLPMSGPVGPHRTVDYVALPLKVASRVQQALGGSLLDVVLTTLAGALRRYLSQHFVNPATLDFRVSAPIALGSDPTGRSIGEWVFALPIWESDPAKCYERVRAVREAEHEQAPATPARDLFPLHEMAESPLPASSARVLSRPARVPVRITWFPGPKQPLYLRGARLEECFGHVPLSGRAGLGVSVFAYGDGLFWGLNADFDRMPDLGRLSEGLRQSFHELDRLADHRPTLVRVS